MAVTWEGIEKAYPTVVTFAGHDGGFTFRAGSDGVRVEFDDIDPYMGGSELFRWDQWDEIRMKLEEARL